MKPGERIPVSCSRCRFQVAELTMPDLRAQLGPLAAMLPAGALDGGKLAEWLELVCVVCIGEQTTTTAPQGAGETTNAA